MRSCAIFIFQYDYFKKSKKFVVDSKDVKKNLLFKLTFNQIQMNQLFHFTIQPNFVPFLVFIHLIQRFCSCNLSSVEENRCFTVKAQAVFSSCKHWASCPLILSELLYIHNLKSAKHLSFALW